MRAGLLLLHQQTFPSFTRCRGRVSYFVISVSGNLKIKIVNRCFHNKMFTFREPARSVFIILHIPIYTRMLFFFFHYNIVV